MPILLWFIYPIAVWQACLEPVPAKVVKRNNTSATPID